MPEASRPEGHDPANTPTAPIARSRSAPSLDSLMEQCILALESRRARRVSTSCSRDLPRTRTFGLRERLGSCRRSASCSAPPSPKIPERLGEFQLLRQIGRGGMGVVYLAEQPSPCSARWR
jgi:hypothetical protein